MPPVTLNTTVAQVLWQCLVEPDPERQSALLESLLDSEENRTLFAGLTDQPERLCEAIAALEFAPAADDWQRLLPVLAAQLSRLRQLEHDFGRQLQTAKLDAMKELAYGAGHEINNPLANISTRAQTLLKDERDPQRRRMLATINRQAFRAHEMIADLMLFARPPAPRFEPVDVVAVIRRVLAELAEEASERRVELQLAPAALTTIEADPNQLAVAIRAVCANAFEAIGSGGRVEILVRAGKDASRPSVEIEIADNGPGMDDCQLAHLFDPFFSGREAGRGLGLGLSKCWRILDSHGGTIGVQSRLGQGATFTINLPVTHAQADVVSKSESLG